MIKIFQMLLGTDLLNLESRWNFFCVNDHVFSQFKQIPTFVILEVHFLIINSIGLLIFFQFILLIIFMRFLLLAFFNYQYFFQIRFILFKFCFYYQSLKGQDSIHDFYVCVYLPKQFWNDYYYLKLSIMRMLLMIFS